MSPHHLAKYTRNNDQLTRRVSRHDNRSSMIKPLSRRRKFIYYSTRLCVRIINSMTNFVTNAKFPTRRKMIKFPRKFKLSIRFTTMKRTKGEDTRVVFRVSLTHNLQFREGRTSDSIRGNEYSHFNGKRNNCTFCHFLQGFSTLADSKSWNLERKIV